MDTSEQKRIDKAIADKNARIDKFVKDKDLNIRVSWAINNAVAIVATDPIDSDRPKGIKVWADWFLEYFEELRDREAANLARAEEEKTAHDDATVKPL